MKEIKLSQPIIAHGNELHVLELKEPTVKDIKKLGFPFDSQMIGDPKKVADYIVALGNVTPSSVEQLTPYDFLMITGEIMMFFGPKEKAENTAEEQQTAE